MLNVLNTGSVVGMGDNKKTKIITIFTILLNSTISTKIVKIRWKYLKIWMFLSNKSSNNHGNNAFPIE